MFSLGMCFIFSTFLTKHFPFFKTHTKQKSTFLLLLLRTPCETHYSLTWKLFLEWILITCTGLHNRTPMTKLTIFFMFSVFFLCVLTDDTFGFWVSLAGLCLVLPILCKCTQYMLTTFFKKRLTVFLVLQNFLKFGFSSWLLEPIVFVHVFFKIFKF